LSPNRPDDSIAVVLRNPSLPNSCLAIPPAVIVVASVMMFRVPPIDGVARLTAESPRWSWMVDVASPTPSQFDQYTHPFSMSLTGTPLIMTATLRWSKPRTLIRASPAAPPDSVEYTLGVKLRTSGMSCDPNC
jgi:hypothetical protein